MCSAALAKLTIESKESDAAQSARAAALQAELAEKHDGALAATNTLRLHLSATTGQLNDKIDMAAAGQTQLREEAQKIHAAVVTNNEQVHSKLLQSQSTQEGKLRVFVSHWSGEVDKTRSDLEGRIKKARLILPHPTQGIISQFS